MDVRYTTEQRALRDAAAKVVDDLAPRSVAQLGNAERSAKLTAAVTATGWRELRAGDDGGPAASGMEVAIVSEELARGLCDTPFLGPMLALDLRRLAGAPEATGVETVALRADLHDLAVPEQPVVVIDATGADAAVALLTDGTLTSVAVDATPGDVVDLTRPMQRATVSSGEPIGELTRQDAQHWSALALAATTADLVGTMQGALDLSVDYAKQRRQYGAPIGSFQAVGHLLAEAAVHVEGARTVLLHAAWAVDALSPADALVAAASAKAYASRAARHVCETAIQVHGGIGHTWECMAHVYLRRSLLTTEVLGGVGPNLDRVLAHAGAGS